MEKSFVKIYEELISKQEKRKLESSNFSDKPIMYDGIITPESSVTIQPVFGIDFSIDKIGMIELLNDLEKRFNQQTDEQNKNLMWITYAVENSINEYFGGRGDGAKRESAYFSNNEHLTLSDIKNERIGLCAERASVAQNCFEVLREAGIIKSYIPHLTNSHLTIKGERTPHSFITLVNEEKSSWIFDIENNIEYLDKDGNKTFGVALYKMSKEELEEFKQGHSLKLKSVYELSGIEECGQDRYYGSEELRTLNEKIEREADEKSKVTPDNISNATSQTVQANPGEMAKRVQSVSKSFAEQCQSLGPFMFFSSGTTRQMH